MPIYSEDFERLSGIPKEAYDFKEIIKEADGIIISFAEHNGAYTAAFKNVFDWISRIEKVVWYNKPMFLMATSEGLKGASSVLQMAYNRMSIGNPNQIPYFSLPNFSNNLSSIIQTPNLKNEILMNNGTLIQGTIVSETIENIIIQKLIPAQSLNKQKKKYFTKFVNQKKIFQIKK